MGNNGSKVMTTAQVAEILGLTPRRVQELAAAGQIPSVRPKGRRKWIFLKSVVAKYAGMKLEDL